MKFNLKNIHIGEYIKTRVMEQEIPMVRICEFFNSTENKICEMYKQKSLDTEILLGWSEILEYDFFRLYTQHLILFAPQGKIDCDTTGPEIQKTSLPQFRKNIYTKEVIDFILELINTGQKTKLQILEDYRIPKSTLHKWLLKYNDKI